MSAEITKLDKQKHKYILMSILLDISKNEILKESLVFKWWTALYLLHSLDRFSTDLDFDLVGNLDKEIILNEIIKILSKYWEIKDSFIKRNTIFAILSYWNIEHNVKIEISTRWVSGKYSMKNFMWIDLNVLDTDYLTANKFFTLLNRKNIANRDIYDIWFILRNNLEINKTYLEKLSEISFENYIKKMINFLENLPKNYNILDWLWAILDEKQKRFVKQNLISETIFLLNSLV